MKFFFMPLLLLMLVVPAAFAQDKKSERSDEVKRLDRATEVFGEIMATPDNAIPEDLLDKAECVAIVPGLTKAALGIGGRYGKGLVMCRGANRQWSAPLFIRIEGGSAGLQIGVQKTDLVMLVMNRRGMDKLLGDKFTLGADASVAAGPVGRNATAQTNVRLDAEILGYSRTKGLFAGLSLEGATLRQDKDDNRDFYGRDIDARALLLEGSVPLPAAARPLAAALSHKSPKKK
ncbi:MAG TPA: lipid-binding SYLF domain-containing protein [Blastocatellia bacterium]|nr:lipid-binding SYLF domain-containing protein [Blastocatellia bacterium]